MTDFATEILPEEEEKAEELLARREDAEEAREAVDTSGEPQDKRLVGLAGVGNAVLTRRLGSPQEPPSAAASAPIDTVTEPELAESAEPVQPATEPVEQPTAPPRPEPEAEPMLAAQAEQPAADPAAERRLRVKLLTRTVARLVKAPEDAPVDALFAAFLDAPVDEQASAALTLANAVLRIDAEGRRRARATLAAAVAEHPSQPLAGILAIRLGAWVSTAPEPTPPVEPEDGP